MVQRRGGGSTGRDGRSAVAEGRGACTPERTLAFASGRFEEMFAQRVGARGFCAADILLPVAREQGHRVWRKHMDNLADLAVAGRIARIVEPTALGDRVLYAPMVPMVPIVPTGLASEEALAAA